MNGHGIRLSTTPLTSQPFGIQFLLWSTRLRVVAGRGLSGAHGLMIRGFTRIGWPEGVAPLESLLVAIDEAWPSTFLVRPAPCGCVTRDELLLARAAALMACELPELVQDELEAVVAVEHADRIVARLHAVVAGLAGAGLPMQPQTIPG